MRRFHSLNWKVVGLRPLGPQSTAGPRLPWDGCATSSTGVPSGSLISHLPVELAPGFFFQRVARTKSLRCVCLRRSPIHRVCGCLSFLFLLAQALGLLAMALRGCGLNLVSQQSSSPCRQKTPKQSSAPTYSEGGTQAWNIDASPGVTLAAGGMPVVDIDDWRVDGWYSEVSVLGDSYAFTSVVISNEGLHGRCRKTIERRCAHKKGLKTTRVVEEQVLPQLQSCKLRQKLGGPAIWRTSEDGSSSVDTLVVSPHLSSHSQAGLPRGCAHPQVQVVLPSGL